MNIILLIAAILNWVLLNGIPEIVIALALFIIAEIIRRKGNGSKATIATQIICGIILVAYALMFIIGLISGAM